MKNKFGQFFNFEGIKEVFKLLPVLHKIKPDLKLNNLCDIDINLLHKNNVKYIVLDKDNTITLPYEKKAANEQILTKLEELKKEFGERNVVIMSNTAGSLDDIEYKEANYLEKSLGIIVLKHEKRKPNVHKEINEYFKNAENSREICIIGDRLFVDILIAYKNSYFGILLKPISRDRENFSVRLARKIENFFI